MKKSILFLLITVILGFRLSGQNGHGLNLKYSYSDIYYPEIIGGVNFIELNYLLKEKRAQLNMGLFKDIPYRYNIGSTIGLNISFKYRLFKIKSRFENFILAGFNVARNDYKFNSYSYHVYNSTITEYINFVDQTKRILGFELGTGFQYNFSPRLHMQIGATYKLNFIKYINSESSESEVIYPTYFLSFNYLLKCDN